MVKKYNTYEMLEELSKDRNKKFKRYNDEVFIISANVQGALFMSVGHYQNVPFNILNYLNELWVIDDVD